MSPTRIRYRLLSVLPPEDVADGCSYRDYTRGFSINDCGVVSGVVEYEQLESTCEGEPFVWSFCENDYLPLAGTSRNLAVLAGEPDFHGIGLDLNNAGVVVGWFGDEATGPDFAQPWVWDLPSYASGTLTNTFAIGTSEYGQASSVNNEGDPLIVGFYYDSATRVPFLTSLATPALDDIPHPDAEAIANHVATPVGTDEANVVGGSFGGVGACPVVQDALQWLTPSSVSVSEFDEDVTGATDINLWRADARASNAQFQAAGSRTYVEDIECSTRAVFWDSSGEPEEIGLLSPLTEEDQTVALAMTAADVNGDAVLIVGREVFEDKPVMWWRDPADSSFKTITLADLTIANATGLEIREFRDVNAHGWILGNATHETVHPYTRAIVLIPDPCPADLDADGFIDGADMAILLGAWGTCGSVDFCLADLNGDGEIAGADMAILLGAWGECDVATVACALTTCLSEMAMSQSGSGSSESAELLAALGFSSVASFAEWTGTATDEQALATGQLLVELAKGLEGGE